MIAERYLRLSQEGGSDIDLNDVSSKRYVVDDAWTPRAWDGASETIDDEIPVAVTGATMQDVLDAITVLRQMLTLAQFRHEHDRSLGRFWLSHYPDSSEAGYAARIRKAEVVGGAVDQVDNIRKATYLDMDTPATAGYACKCLVRVRHGVARGAVSTALLFHHSDTYEPAAQNDDATINALAFTIDLSGADLKAGEDAADFYFGVRFHVDIAPGATINSARVDFVASANQAVDDCDLLIAGELAADPAVFSTFNDFWTRLNGSGTVATVSWNAVEHWADGTTYSTPDLASIIQEIVSDPAWVGDHIVIFVSYTPGCDPGACREAASLDHVSYPSPRLVVDWTPPSGSDTKRISNHDDAYHDNYVSVDPATQQAGELPAACDVYATNVSPGGDTISGLWLGLAYPQGAHGFSFNADDANTNTDTAKVDDYSAPGTGGAGGIGRRAECTFATSQAMDLAHWRLGWTIASADVSKYQGRYKVLLRARADAGTDVITAQLAVRNTSSGTGYSESDAATIIHAATGWIWHDLGVIDIPAGNVAEHVHLPFESALTLLAGSTGTTDHLHIADMLLIPAHASMLYVPYAAGVSGITAVLGRYHIDEQWRQEDGIMSEVAAADTVLDRVHYTGQLPLFVPEQSYGAYMVFACSYYTSSQSYAPIDLEMEVSADYTPRWYTL